MLQKYDISLNQKVIRIFNVTENKLNIFDIDFLAIFVGSIPNLILILFSVLAWIHSKTDISWFGNKSDKVKILSLITFGLQITDFISDILFVCKLTLNEFQYEESILR